MKSKGGPILRESDIQRYVKERLELDGWFVINTHGALNRPIHEGITDLIVVKYGFVAWIEVKRPSWNYCKDGNIPSKTEVKEIEFKRQIKAAGGCYGLIQTHKEADEDIIPLNEKAEKYRKWRANNA